MVGCAPVIWVYTSTPEGYITILDRKKTSLFAVGETLACLDVEGALHTHPDVNRGCAFFCPPIPGWAKSSGRLSRPRMASR